MKYNIEYLNKVLKDKKTWVAIAKELNYSDVYVRKLYIKLGIFKPRPIKRKDNREKIKRKCEYCKKEITGWGKPYCSKDCNIEANKKNKYKDFLENNEKYCRANYSPKIFKPQILKEQNNKCAICNINPEWNNKNLVFILDHIDGNAANNKRENLRLVCPNCDSQLDTYKSKNKNSARKERYLLNYKIKIEE